MKLQNFLRFFASSKDKSLLYNIHQITGFKPGNLDVYKLAISHVSMAQENHSGSKDSYERLEYLGDAVLGAVVAEFLFKKYPFKDEGFLTDTRSRIVNREMLNTIGRKIGLDEIVQYSGKANNSHKSLYGDVLEALVGAIYLDKGFFVCKKFILSKILQPHIDMDTILSTTKNFKSVLIEWCQKENKKLRFVIVDEKGLMHNKEFTSMVEIDQEEVSRGIGTSKKRAEQSAAEKACLALGLK